MMLTKIVRVLFLHGLLTLPMAAWADGKVTTLPDCSGKNAKEAWCRDRHSEKEIKHAREVQDPPAGGVLGHYAGIKGKGKAVTYSVLKPHHQKNGKKPDNPGD